MNHENPREVAKKLLLEGAQPEPSSSSPWPESPDDAEISTTYKLAQGHDPADLHRVAAAHGAEIVHGKGDLRMMDVPHKNAAAFHQDMKTLGHDHSKKHPSDCKCPFHGGKKSEGATPALDANDIDTFSAIKKKLDQIKPLAIAIKNLGMEYSYFGSNLEAEVNSLLRQCDHIIGGGS